MSCYRGLLALRREFRALHAGTLEWIAAPWWPRDVVAYRRLHGEGASREQAEVFLNFSRSTTPLALGGRTGSTLFSNRRGDRIPAPRDYALGPYEGVVVLGGPSDPPPPAAR